MLLENNNLTGEIPENIENLINLKLFRLHNNNINGTILESLVNMSQLERVNLSSNQFSGEIPNEIGNLTELQYLKLFTFDKNFDKDKFTFPEILNIFIKIESEYPRAALGIKPLGTFTNSIAWT